MKKLLLLTFLFFFSFIYSQDEKVSVKINTTTSGDYEIIASENEFSKIYELTDSISREEFKIRLIQFYKSNNDSVSVTIDAPHKKIKIEALKKSLESEYDLTVDTKQKEFKEKLESFYNSKKKETINNLAKRLKVLENDPKEKETIGFLEFLINKNSSVLTYYNNIAKKDCENIKKDYKNVKNDYNNIKKKIDSQKNRNELKLIKEKLSSTNSKYEISIRNPTIGKEKCYSKHDSVKIDSISIQIKGGSIYEVFIRTQSNKIFHGNDYPITLEKFLTIKNKNEYKILNIEDSKQFINFTNIVRYLPKINNHFIPKDTVISKKISLDKFEKTPLKKDIYLNKYIESTIYTDLFSLLDKEANGQLQTEFSTKFLLNTVSIPTYYGYFFHYIQPKVKYSILSDENKYIDLNQENINVIDIKRRSYLDLDLKLNLFKGERRNRFEADVSIGFNYTFTKSLRDSIQSSINLFEPYFQVGFLVKEYHNFGMSGNFKLSCIDKNTSSNNINSESFKNNWFIVPEFEIYYYPIKEKKNKVFLRFQYVANTRDHSNDFSKLQFGYKIPIKFKQKTN